MPVGGEVPDAVRWAFDPARLTQARHLAGVTKKALAEAIGVTAAAVGQYEVGASRPRPDLIPLLARELDVPPEFFVAGRPHGRLDTSTAHFRSLRSTRAYQRAKAIAYTEQAWELVNALEKRVDLPPVDLPGVDTDDPQAAARTVRAHWGLGGGPVTHLVRRLEAHGVVVLTPPRDPDADSVDAFSTTRLTRPIVVLTRNRADDVHRHRFTAAHELGHLVLHHESAVPGDPAREREADAFAAEFLTPRDSILPALPKRVDLKHLADLRRTWGVSVHSLVYRCRELGLISDSAAGRAYQRLHALADTPGFAPEPVDTFPGELPSLLAKAYELACAHGLDLAELATELSWHPARVRELLGVRAGRPVLTLVE
ncbi:XRE family transcriptional regulator [Actinosynnema sp. NPDC020468]|uniref:helix-turn-helix domain-containing protein n=1 Tax=Actinosynnema sp. NPDC020468 TaxID=3154488 RepID=UPI0033DE2D16